MTTHKATAERQGRFWVVSIDGLPEAEQNVTQGLTWTEAHENARELVSLVLDIEDDPAAYTVDLVPADPAMFEVASHLRRYRNNGHSHPFPCDCVPLDPARMGIGY
ncbi:hypothetical protein [Streptomyces halstedii]|uniref:hypothetical protein n=1 Tax=Streptomyces halstedii TaxID=1944 RepID=UPI0033AF581D